MQSDSQLNNILSLLHEPTFPNALHYLDNYNELYTITTYRHEFTQNYTTFNNSNTKTTLDNIATLSDL